MSSILVRFENRPIFFFNNLQLAIEETGFYYDFAVYQFDKKEQYIIGESNALMIHRPHFYDWNGLISPYSRLDGNTIEQWRVSFKNKLEKVIIDSPLISVEEIQLTTEGLF